MAGMTGRHEVAAASAVGAFAAGFEPGFEPGFAIDKAFNAPDDAPCLAHEAGGHRARGAAPGEGPSTDYLLLF